MLSEWLAPFRAPQARKRVFTGRSFACGASALAKPQHIGIVACSAEGAALCYRTICIEGAQLLGAYGHPEVSMHSHPLVEYVRFIDRADWRGVADLMLASARKLERAGAEFLICPDNTVHQALPTVVQETPLPWLHIADVVTAEALKRDFRRLGLTGTRSLVESEIYPERLKACGIACVRPSEAEREAIDCIIMDELVYGMFKPQSIAYFAQVMARMKEEGCDAVILGCTELPLIVEARGAALPVLDSTRLLARAALQAAVANATGG